MASSISHVVYSKKYLDQHPAMNADLFLLGTLLPDIRRVADNLSRKETHSLYTDLETELKNLSPFEAGYRYHLWCDMRREEILNKYDFYSLKYTAEMGHLPAKLLEDELVYEKYANWEKLCWLLNHPPEIKSELQLPRGIIERWYSINAKYFEKKPDDKTVKNFLWKQKKLRKRSPEIIDLVGKLRNNSKVVDILPKISEEILE